MRPTAFAAALLLSVTALAQNKDKPATLAQVMARTAKLKAYDFHIKGSPDDLSGTFEAGTVDFQGGGVEAAGKGALTYSKVDGQWAQFTYHFTKGMGGMTLRRLGKLDLPHNIALRVSNSVTNLRGDSEQGFTAELSKQALGSFCREPWIDRTDLPNAANLRGTCTIKCQNNLISSLALQIQGRVPFYTQNNGMPMPGPGGRGAVPGQGYNYGEKDVTLNIEIELSGYDTAKVSDSVKKVVGY